MLMSSDLSRTNESEDTMHFLSDIVIECKEDGKEYI